MISIKRRFINRGTDFTSRPDVSKFVMDLNLQLDDLVFAVNNQFISLPVYANNALALAGGLKAGQPYRTGGDPDVVAVVH